MLHIHATRAWKAREKCCRGGSTQEIPSGLAHVLCAGPPRTGAASSQQCLRKRETGEERAGNGCSQTGESGGKLCSLVDILPQCPCMEDKIESLIG